MSSNVATILCAALAGLHGVESAPSIQPLQHSLKHDGLQFLAGSKFDPLDTGHFVGNLKCGVTVQVHSGSDKYEQCPEECPYYAQDIHDGLHCSFICVKAEQCVEMNPNRPIADTIKGHKTCRGPIVADCSEMSLDGTDTCLKCQMFYKVGIEGNCIFQHWEAVIIVLSIFGIIFLFIATWVGDLIFRPNKNEEGMRQGLAFRSNQKIHTPHEEGGSRRLFPDDTNLCKTDVAGPGMLLHFNFQVVCCVWAFLVACVWLCFCTFVDNDLFTMGMRKFGTPRENCILVAWGFETQQRLMWTKVTFLIITYILTFGGSMAHGIRQMRIFDLMDANQKTMKDYCALVTGLELTGDGKHEEKLAQVITAASGEKVLGVSICWNWKDHEELVESVLEEDLQVREDKQRTGIQRRTTTEENLATSDEHSEGMSGMRKSFYKKEIEMLGWDGHEDKPEEGLKEWLKKLESSDEAFVVFDTEESRNKACEKVQDSGLEYEGSALTMEVFESEPDTINFINYGHSSFAGKLCRLIQGIGWILLALFFWTTVFYTPYAYQVFTFNYDNGAEPPFTLAMTFCMVVVLGNAIMYEVCGRVSDYIGFKTRDHREACYLILYVIACCFNVALDMVTTYFMSMEILKGLNFRTYYGVKLEDVPTFTQQFETYAMQRILAENTKCYCFPATFLIPFILEPFITVYFPLKLGQWMVRSHPEWVGRDAELWMVAFEFDMGRYGDLLLNMLLGICIFYFPGGYTLLLFFGMAGSHAYIYLFDHLRVIKTIPKCVYSTMEVDWWAQWMLAPITATILSCMVFKANCQDYGYCVKGMTLIEYCCGAWFFHFILHWVCLSKVVPLFRKTDHADPKEGQLYKTASQEHPCSWFAANPIHCMRSKYYYEHNPPCSFYHLGKEHLQEVNPKIHCYFDSEIGGEEDYTKSDLNFGVLTKSFTGSIVGH